MNELTSPKVQDIPALVISGVCSRWRDLSKAHPCLWSRIRLHFQSTTRHLPTDALMNTFIDSSQQCPLTLELPARTLGELETHQQHLCDVLGSQKPRWKQVKIGHRAAFQVVIAQGPSHFPILEQLLIPALQASLPTDIRKFQQVPSLKVLSVGRLPLQSMPNFMWNQLTHLSLAQFHGGIKSIFERCPELKDLFFRQPSSHDSVHSSTPPLIAPVVESLSLRLSQPPTFPPNITNVVFESLRCPSLTSLLIEATEGYRCTWPRNEVNEFISHSSCHLTTLFIEFVPLSDTNLIDLLHLLPSLLHLTLDDSKIRGPESPITSHLIQSLHAFRRTGSNMISPALVRRLHSLSLTSSGSNTDTTFDRDFVDMVLSRWRPDVYASGYGLDTSGSTDSEGGTACLRSVVMRFTNRNVDLEMYRQLEHLEKEGMRVVVVGQSL
ncbi:hypothetical protein BT96DRAFT_1016305 [Gymnopus androsaceus JB14]|uniref:F-box domain-containing protein n=1 Tax=Gymnopus androsaceus JB14 TaxID=1447944 RepID=A0A6A4I4X6_9AGAR|nr:hypothetical protein BT96DRAFT_1016305 [Gymnopus androsaceus JB14]